MSRPVEPQSQRFATSPHVPEGPAVPDSYWYDDSTAEHHRYNDEEFGLNREPPSEHHIHDPGFNEH